MTCIYHRIYIMRKVWTRRGYKPNASARRGLCSKKTKSKKTSNSNARKHAKMKTRKLTHHTTQPLQSILHGTWRGAIFCKILMKRYTDPGAMPGAGDTQREIDT